MVTYTVYITLSLFILYVGVKNTIREATTRLRSDGCLHGSYYTLIYQKVFQVIRFLWYENDSYRLSLRMVLLVQRLLELFPKIH